MILNFAHIEAATNLGLVQFSSDKISSVVLHLGFAVRADLLCAVLRAKPGRDEAIPEIVRMLKEAKQLAEDRNLVAHSPVQWSVYSHGEKGFTFIDEIVHPVKLKRKLTYRALIRSSDRAEKLQRLLWESIMALISRNAWNLRETPLEIAQKARDDS